MHGSWIWRELLTRDPARAADFYAQLLGWSTVDAPGGTQLCCNGTAFASLVSTGTGDPPNQWVLCAAVHDVAGAASAVTELGGRVMGDIADAPGGGLSAHIRDPDGAHLALLQHSATAPGEGPGTPIWQELHTPRAAGARDFYTGLLGWRFGKMPLPGGADYHMASGTHGDAAGMLQCKDPSQPSAWLQYFAVESADATAQQVGALGGSIALGPAEIPGVGRMALLVDNCGAVFAVLA